MGWVEQLAFGPFCLDVRSSRLLRDGVPVDLRPQAFQALRTLLHHRGCHVDYEQMIAEAWEGTLVSRHTVAVTVGEAKKALKEYGCWIHYRPKLGYCIEIPRCDDQVKMGWHFTRRHTREGFEKALACFEKVLDEDRSDFRALKGMCTCYLMLGAYGMREPRKVYAAFLDAHSRAVELEGLTPELRSDRGHARHVFVREFEQAEADLCQALREDPSLMPTYGHLAVLYVTTRRFDLAIDTLARAQRVDALWPMLKPMETLVRYCRREFDLAVAAGRASVELHPYFPPARHLYAQALERSGRMDEALEQHELSCAMSPDLPWARAERAACLARAGHTEEAWEIYQELEWLRSREYVNAYSMIVLLESLGRRDLALDELDRAVLENSATLFLLDADPKLDPLRGEPRFQRVSKMLFGPLSGADRGLPGRPVPDSAVAASS